MKEKNLSYLGNILAKVMPARRVRAQTWSAPPSQRLSGRTSTRFCPALEMLEDRSMPSLIAGQVLPLLVPPTPVNPGPPADVATVNTVTVLAPALSAASPTAQEITLTNTISGAPTGGTVSFTVAGLGTVDNVPVVNGVAQFVFTIPAGSSPTAGGTVTATYSGTTGYAGSTSSGAGNGTLTFCMDNNSTLLGSTLQTFAVLAGSTVTNTGPTIIVGNVGVSPGSAVTGFPPGNVTGTIHTNDAVTLLAQTELTAAYTTILTETVGFTDLTGVDLGGLTLTPGRYHFDTSAQLTGTLILDNQNVPDARFDFQIGSTLTTASSSRILFINGGADNVYWQVGSSATLGSSTVFAGNILAQADITLVTNASIACGRALTRTGAVTLDSNFIDPVPHDHGEGEADAPSTTLSGRLSQLRQEHGFRFVDSYYQNYYGANERWFQDRNNQFWALTASGDLVKWDGRSFATSLSAATTVYLDQFDAAPSVYNDPNLLFNAAVVTPAGLLSELSQLRQEHGFHFAASYSQNYHGANEKWFQDRNNQFWALTSSGDLVKWDGFSFVTSLNAFTTVHLGQVDAAAPTVFDDPNLLFNAVVVMPAGLRSLLAELRQDHGFRFVNSYYQNYYGANEKWFQDRNNQFWALTASGDLVKWDGRSFATSLSAATTVHLGQFDAAARTVFDDPNLLFNCGCHGVGGAGA